MLKEMSKIDYDLNSSGGLMPLIQALIRPPDSRETSRQANKKQPHPYYRRPGRGHNHDCCDACQEGGDLICCDKCPASFHLGCHDPPLSEEDIPAGLWLCHTCRVMQQNQKLNIKSHSNSIDCDIAQIEGDKIQSRPDTPTANDIINKAAKIRSESKRSLSRVSSCSEHSSSNEKDVKRKSVQSIVPIENGINGIDTNVVISDDQSKACETKIDEIKDEIDTDETNIDKSNTQTDLRTPWDELIRAASIMNPRQFQLPREMSVFVKFPGDDKVLAEPNKACTKKNNNRNGSNGNNTRGAAKHELDAQGLVPLPAKTCFYCRRSCKKAPLIACDYCPLFFHQDCLDPPLTAFPTGLWMCPHHPEQFVDWKLVSSISATERIKLWDQFSGPVDQEIIKSDFLRKVHCKNPPFRFKLKPKPRICAEIPPMVEFHYKHPPKLMPSLRDVLRCERVYQRGAYSELSNEELCTELDKDLHELQEAKQKIQRIENDDGDDVPKDNNADANAMDIDDIKQERIEIGEKQIDKEQIQKTVKADIKAQELTESAMPNMNKTEREKDITEEELPMDKSMHNGNGESHTTETNENTSQLPTTKVNGNRSNKRKRISSTKSFGVECMELLDLSPDAFKSKRSNGATNGIAYPQKIDDELKCLDLAVIKELAFRQLQQILSENTDLVAKYQTETANKAIKDALKVKPIKITLPSQLLSTEDIAKIAEQFANSSSSENEIGEDNEPRTNGCSNDLRVPKTCVNVCYTNGFEHIQSDSEKAMEIARRLETPLHESKIRARAVLTPVDDILSGKRWYTDSTIGDSIFMRYRNVTIGTGNGCDLQFKNLRKCARLSARHANIFYDEVTKVYELLNYSEFGTEVNGQRYSCDFTEYPELNENRVKDVNGFYENIRNILDKKRGVNRIDYKYDENEKMAAPELPDCCCKNYPPLIKGWEGSAILSHGTLLRFGCLAYVFSIVNESIDD